MAKIIPPEIWLHIASYLTQATVENSLRPVCRKFWHLFSDQRLYGLAPKTWGKISAYLDYYALLSLKETSREFRDLLLQTSSSALHGKMFVERLSKNPLSSGTPIALHPIFSEIFITRPHNSMDRMVTWNLFECLGWSCALDVQEWNNRPVLWENVTSPPIREMTISIPSCEPVTIKPTSPDHGLPLAISVGATISAFYSIPNEMTRQALDSWGVSSNLENALRRFSKLDGMRIVGVVEAGRKIQILEAIESPVLHSTPWDHTSSREPTSEDEREIARMPLAQDTDEEEDQTL